MRKYQVCYKAINGAVLNRTTSAFSAKGAVSNIQQMTKGTRNEIVSINYVKEWTE